MKIILRALKPYVLRIFIGTILSTGSGLSVLMIIRSINVQLQNQMADFDLQYFLIKFGLLILSFSILAVGSTLILSKISNQIILDLRLSMSEKVMNSKFEPLEFKRSELMAVLNTDIRTIGGVMNRVPGIISRAVIGFGGVSYLLYISWKLSLIILGIFGIVVIITYFTNKNLNEISKIARKSHTKVLRALMGMIYGIKEMYSNPQHKNYYLKNQLPEVFEEEFEQSIKERINTEISNKSTEGLMLIGIGILIILINLYSVVGIGQFIEFLTVSLFIINPLSTVAGFTKTLSPFRAAMAEIEELGISMDQNRNRTTDAIPANDLHQPITFNDITFKYYNSDIDDFFQLGPLNFEIERKKITMIIGGNGSGKTTLAKIICGLYLPQKGHIKMGNSEIVAHNLDTFRNNFSVIFTDNFLYTDFSYIQGWDDEKANELLELLVLSHKISFTNQQAARDLSMGQQKRLALIKALMENKEIFLFDEWAANQDPRFKKIFYSQIIPELKSQKKTVVLISHDDAYFDTADNIIHLREGKMYMQEKH